MKQNGFFSILFFILISFWTISCNENSSNGFDNGDSTPIDVSLEVVSAENVFVYVPSPIETASLLKDALNRRERFVNELREIDAKILSTSDDPYIDELIKENNNTC